MNSIDLDGAKKLLYHFVHTHTNIRRTKDFTSQFASDAAGGNLILTGYLKTIDPISHSVILCLIDEQTGLVSDNILILGQNISDIKLADNGNKIDCKRVKDFIDIDSHEKLKHHPYFQRPTKPTLTRQELSLLQGRIIEWFTKWRVPIELNEETQELVVKSVRIRPPYEHEADYVAPSRILLRGIKHMVDQSRTIYQME